MSDLGPIGADRRDRPDAARRVAILAAVLALALLVGAVSLAVLLRRDRISGGVPGSGGSGDGCAPAPCAVHRSTTVAVLSLDPDAGVAEGVTAGGVRLYLLRLHFHNDSALHVRLAARDLSLQVGDVRAGALVIPSTDCEGYEQDLGPGLDTEHSVCFQVGREAAGPVALLWEAEGTELAIPLH